MPEHSVINEVPYNDPGVERPVALYADCWEQYQNVLRYLRQCGKEHPPTGRLILLTMIGHEADASQISIDAGACAYAINTNLAHLTKQGILVRRPGTTLTREWCCTYLPR